MRRVYRLIILGLVGASGAGILSLAKNTVAREPALSGMTLDFPREGAWDDLPQRAPHLSRAVNDCLPQALSLHVAKPAEGAADAATLDRPDDTVSTEVQKGDRIAFDRQALDARLTEGTFAGADISQCVDSQIVTGMDEEMQRQMGDWELRL